jgi:hypothetical protein
MAIFQYWLLWHTYVMAIYMVFMGVFSKISKDAVQQRKRFIKYAIGKKLWPKQICHLSYGLSLTKITFNLWWVQMNSDCKMDFPQVKKLPKAQILKISQREFIPRWPPERYFVDICSKRFSLMS